MGPSSLNALPDLFEHLDDCYDSTPIQIKSNNEVTLYGGFFNSIGLYFTNKEKENQETINKVVELLEGWSFYQNITDNTIKNSIKSKITSLPNDGYLRVTGKLIREIYKDVIKKNIQNPFFAEIIHKSNNETISITSNDVDSLYNLCGKERILRALNIYGHTSEILEGETISVKVIRQAMLSLCHISISDLEETYQYIKEYAQDNSKFVPTQIGGKYDKDVVDNLFNDSYPNTFEELNPDQKKEIIRLTRFNRDEIELCRLGLPKEGLLMHATMTWFFSEYYEESEILHVVENLLDWVHDEPNNEENVRRYTELLDKVLVKKESSRYQENLIGRVFPGPAGESYVFEETVNIWGRVAVSFKPVCDKNNFSHLVYRSTSSSIVSSTCASSIFQDLWKPGYFKFWSTMQAEVRWALTDINPLIVSGHSLGGCFAQLFAVFFAKIMKTSDKNLIERLRDPDLSTEEFKQIMRKIALEDGKDGSSSTSSLFERDIKVITWDSPGIGTLESNYINKLQEQGEFLDKLTVEHNISRGDIVPYGMGPHLGTKWSNTVSVMRWPKDDVNVPPRMKLHTHGNLYLADKNYTQFVEESVSMEPLHSIDNSYWKVAAEVLRLVVSFFLWPIFYLLSLPREISRMWKKNYSWSLICSESLAFWEYLGYDY